MVMDKSQDAYLNPYPPKALPNMGSNQPFRDVPAPDPIPPEPPAPPAQDMIVRSVLAIGLPFMYVLLLILFAIEWLNFGHPNLEAPVVGGFGLLAGWAGNEFSHFSGASNTTRSFLTGLRARR